MRRRIVVPTFALVLVASLSACGGGGGGDARATGRSSFSYDSSTPLGYRDLGRVNHGYPIQVRDVSYASPRGGRVKAYLIVPPGKGPFPAVLFLHGSGEDRTRMVLPATYLAARGVVGLAIDSAFVRNTRPYPRDPVRRLERERDLAAQTVVDLRRGVDVLDSLPQVDPSRIGFLGYSAGAKVGALLAGAEPRIRAFDLMSGGSPSVAAFAAAAPSSIRPQIERVLEQMDPLRALSHAKPAALFFQDGLRDQDVPRAQLLAFERAGRSPKLVRWYPAGHALNAQASRDQLAWLSRELRAKGPTVPGALTGP